MTQVVAKSWIMNKNIWLKTTVLLLAQRRLITFLKESQMAQNYCEIINTSFGGVFWRPWKYQSDRNILQQATLNCFRKPMDATCGLRAQGKNKSADLAITFFAIYFIWVCPEFPNNSVKFVKVTSSFMCT